jgi:hypothetical protein
MMAKRTRYSDDPELAAAFEENERWMIERVKQAHRDRLEREAREARRRARLRRLTFGLLGR